MKTPVLQFLFLRKLQAKETPTQMFSCEHLEIFKNAYFKEHWRTAASVLTTTWIL